MADSTGVFGGRRNRHPLGLDLHDPEGVAEFLLGVGYDHDNVAAALTRRCGVDRLTAQRIVSDVAHPTTTIPGGHE